MGTTQSSYHRPFLNKEQELTFYIDVDDPNLGVVPVYTSKKMPLCYILKITREIEDSKVFNLFQRIQNTQINSLVSLYGFQLNRNKCCDKIINETVTSYWEYYNFYFNDYLEKRSMKACLFMETQIWHIVQNCCQGVNMLRKYNCYYDLFPKTMVVTPEGKLKLIWWHLKSQNKHIKYFKYFETGQLESIYYSPQELDLLNSKQLTNKINFDKCNAFGLGIILLQCITLTDPFQTIYNPDFKKINFKYIKNVIQNKVIPNYSQNVVSLLGNLLAKDPKDRLTLSKVSQHYNNQMCDDYQLRVCGGKKPQQTQKQQGQGINKQKASDFSDTKTVKLNYTNNKD